MVDHAVKHAVKHVAINVVKNVGYLVSVLVGALVASHASSMPPSWFLGLLLLLAGLLIWKAKTLALYDFGSLKSQASVKNHAKTRGVNRGFDQGLNKGLHKGFNKVLNDSFNQGPNKSSDITGTTHHSKKERAAQTKAAASKVFYTLLIKSCTLLSCFILGFSLLLLRAQFSLQKQWPSELEGRSLLVRIEPLSQLQRGERAWRFLAEVQQADLVEGQSLSPELWPQLVGAKVRLNLYFSGAKRYLAQSSDHVKRGEATPNTRKIRGSKANDIKTESLNKNGLNTIGLNKISSMKISPKKNTLDKSTLDKNPSYLSPAEMQSVLDINPGRTIIAEVKLRSPRGSHNFSAADYQARMLSQSISASGYIKRIIHISGEKRLSQPMQLGRFIDQQTLKHGALIKGLLLGDRSDLSSEHWSLLQKTGTGHLLAISGLHIGLSAAIGLIIFGVFGRCMQLFFKNVPPAQTLALVGSGLTALAYAYLADFSLPTQRALIMLWVYLLAALSGRVISPWRVFAVALLTLLFVDPWALEQAGGCLSFAAVAALIYGYWGRVTNHHGNSGESLSLFSRIKHYSWQLLRSQFLIASFLTAVLFSLQLPSGVLSMPANLLAIPWLSIVIMPLLLLFCVLWFLGTSATWLLNWADFALDILLNFLQGLLEAREQLESLALEKGILEDAELGHALWWPAIEFTGFAFFLMLLFGILWWLPKGFHGRLLALIPLLCLLLPSSALHSPPDKLHITIMDVGQGLAVLIQKDSRAVLYDTGPRFSSEHNAGASVVAPFLRARGLRSLDHLIVSHGDTDHSGGLASLVDQFQVKTLWSEPSYLNALPTNARTLNNIRACTAGHIWHWQGLTFQWLWPGSDPVEKAVAKRDNNRSCVLLMSYHNVRILLPGDIEKWAEKEILNNVALEQNSSGSLVAKAKDSFPHITKQTTTHITKQTSTQNAKGLLTQNAKGLLTKSAKGFCNIDLMLLPHHGSHSSSHKAWANCTKPAVVVSSSAWQNQFGHPSPKVLRRYPSSMQFDTGRDGAIQLTYELVVQKLNNKPVSAAGELEQKVQLSEIRLSRRLRKRYWHRD